MVWGSLIKRTLFCSALLGVGAIGGVELGAEVSDRGAEIRETAAHRDAQPPSAHVHRPHRQREEPREWRAASRAVRLNRSTNSLCSGTSFKRNQPLSVSISPWRKKREQSCMDLKQTSLRSARKLTDFWPHRLL